MTYIATTSGFQGDRVRATIHAETGERTIELVYESIHENEQDAVNALNDWLKNPTRKQGE